MRKFIISMFIVLSTLITPISAYEIDEIPEYRWQSVCRDT